MPNEFRDSCRLAVWENLLSFHGGKVADCGNLGLKFAIQQADRYAALCDQVDAEAKAAPKEES